MLSEGMLSWLREIDMIYMFGEGSQESLTSYFRKVKSDSQIVGQLVVASCDSL